MWIYVVTSFTRYSKVGRMAQKQFEKSMQKDGFHHLHVGWGNDALGIHNAIVDKAQ